MAATEHTGALAPTLPPRECPVLAQITPAKSAACYPSYNTCRTPTGRPHLLQHLGVNSPRSFTPGSVRSGSSASSSSRSGSSQGSTPGSRQFTPAGLRTPRVLSARKYNPSPMARDLALHLTPKYMTPKGKIIFNPFETGLLDTLGQPLLSPNVFAQTSTPNSDDGISKPFRWSIEHLAELNPVDIEEIPPSHHFLSHELDFETEEKAQQAIETFFSKSCVVPSPWSDTSQRKAGLQLPQTPSTPDLHRRETYMMMANAAREQVQAALAALDDEHHPTEIKQDVGCQTALSLPNNFDLEKILGEYYNQDLGDQDVEEKDMSSSSLRRKLFFHGDVGTPLSPVRGRRHDRNSMPMEYVCSSPNISPVKPDTPENDLVFVKNTPGSADQFSSSPIGNKEKFASPGLRRCSTAPDLMMSLEMSPIVSLNERKPNSASSANFSSPLCMPLRGTPSSGVPSGNRGSRPLDTPGFSPIRHVNVVDHNDSYTDLSIGHKKSSGEKRKSPDTLSASREGTESESDPEEQEGVVSNFQTMEYGMEYEMTPVLEKKPFTFCAEGFQIQRSNVAVFATSTKTDFTDLDPYSDHTDRSVDPVVTTSQDTGYNTNSLQISNADAQFSSALGNCTQAQSSIINYNPISQHNFTSTSFVAHTDLTAQFSNMPISSGPNMDVSEGYDSGDELGTSSGMNSYSKRSSSNSSLIIKEKFPPDPLCDIESDDEQVCISKGERPSGISSWHEGQMLQRAHEILSKLDEPRAVGQVTKRIIRKTARKKELTTECDTTKNPAAMATPYRQQYQRLGVVPDDLQTNNLFASDVARRVLQRAEEDVARFCQAPTDQTHMVRSTSMPENFTSVSPDL